MQNVNFLSFFSKAFCERCSRKLYLFTGLHTISIPFLFEEINQLCTLQSCRTHLEVQLCHLHNWAIYWNKKIIAGFQQISWCNVSDCLITIFGYTVFQLSYAFTYLIMYKHLVTWHGLSCIWSSTIIAHSRIGPVCNK